MTSNPADLSMLTEIWVIEEYTPKEFEINTDDVVIDIGAYLGFFSLYAAKLASNGKVHCFEPLPNNFFTLSKNI